MFYCLFVCFFFKSNSERLVQQLFQIVQPQHQTRAHVRVLARPGASTSTAAAEARDELGAERRLGHATDRQRLALAQQAQQHAQRQIGPRLERPLQGRGQRGQSRLHQEDPAHELASQGQHNRHRGHQQPVYLLYKGRQCHQRQPLVRRVPLQHEHNQLFQQ